MRFSMLIRPGRPASRRASAGRGFTLLELLVVMVIIGLLAGYVGPKFFAQIGKAETKTARAQLDALGKALDQYRRAVDQGLIARRMGESGYPPTLEVLVAGTPNAQDPKGGRIYFLRRLPRDPLFPDANAPAAATWGRRSYASAADDPRDGDDVFDVYSLASGAGMNGIAYREW